MTEFNPSSNPIKLSRRMYLSALGLLGLSTWMAPSLTMAKKPEAMEAIAKIVGSNSVFDGRVKLVIPDRKSVV